MASIYLIKHAVWISHKVHIVMIKKYVNHVKMVVITAQIHQNLIHINAINV